LPNNTRVLTASRDSTVLQWDVASGESLDLTLKHPGGVRSLDISTDGRQAITVCQVIEGTDVATSESNYHRLCWWDLDTATLLGHQDVYDQTVSSIAFSRDNQSALVVSATGGAGGQVYRWDLDSEIYRRLWRDNVKRGAIWSAAESNEPGYVLTVGGSYARLWSQDEGTLVQSLSPHGPLNSVCFSPDGTLAVTASSDGTVKIWQLDDQVRRGYVVGKIPAAHGKGGTPHAVNSAVFWPDTNGAKSILLTAGDDGTARLWQLEDGKPQLQDGQLKPLAELSGHQGPVTQAVFSRDGRMIATVSLDGAARVWDWDPAVPETVKSRLEISADTGQSLGLHCADFSPDGSKLVIGGGDTAVKVFDLSDPEQPEVLEGHTASLTSVAFSPNGKRIVSGSQDRMVRVWDAENYTSVLSLNRHTGEVTSVEFSQQGDRILSSSADKSAILWMTLPFEVPEHESDPVEESAE
jgi:WD40 repeat protein